jgi:ribosomal protein L44E
MVYRSEYNDTAKPDDTVRGPLWKRSTHSVKHIRGIFLEESREKAKSMSDASTSKAADQSKKALNKSEVAVDSKPGFTLTPMVCPKCRVYKTKSRRDLTVHLHNELSYQRYKKLIKSSRFGVYLKLCSQGWKTSTNCLFLRYRCIKCGLKFVTENSLRGHITGDHGINYNDSVAEVLPEDPDIEKYVSEITF